MAKQEIHNVMRLQQLQKTLEHAIKTDIAQRKVDTASFKATRDALDYVCHQLGVHSFAQIGV
jgi:hypothetical protein